MLLVYIYSSFNIKLIILQKHSFTFFGGMEFLGVKLSNCHKFVILYVQIFKNMENITSQIQIINKSIRIKNAICLHYFMNPSFTCIYNNLDNFWWTAIYLSTYINYEQDFSEITSDFYIHSTWMYRIYLYLNTEKNIVYFSKIYTFKNKDEGIVVFLPIFIFKSHISETLLL